ncbi:MAG TPA: amidohydrolase family protein [Chloroflexota bacterium]|jgi:predicted TIM-barrel fold metal-dependent hydrolase
MARTYTVISGDSHLDLPPDPWRDHIPAKYREHGPRTVHLESGDAIQMGDRKPNSIGYTRSVNVSKEQLHLQVPRFGTAGGTGGPDQRVQEQDQDGIDAEVLFSRVGYLRQAPDIETYLALMHAYNEYLGQEYQAAAPDRLIPMGVVPTSGVEDAVRELEHCAQVGLRGVAIDKFPSGKGLPTPEDDKFWVAALDLNLAITQHTVGGSTRMTGRDEPTFSYKKGPAPGEEDSAFAADPMRHWFFRFCGDAACAPVQMAFAGVWDRFPRLRIYWAETLIGWLEYALYQMDDHYERYKYLGESLYGLDRLERQPSEYIKEHCLWGFLSDPIGIKHRHESVGPEKLIWGSDFAHAASDWPNSRKAIERDFDGVPPDERHEMLAGNVIRLFALNGA